MATKSKKTTKTTKSASKRTTAGRTASKKTCCSACKSKQMSTAHLCTFVALSLCFVMTAMVMAIILIGAKMNNDALAHNIEADRANFSSAVYDDETEE